MVVEDPNGDVNLIEGLTKLGENAVFAVLGFAVPSVTTAEESVSTLLIYTDDKPLKEFIIKIEYIIEFYVEKNAASNQFDRGVFASLEHVIVERDINTDFL